MKGDGAMEQQAVLEYDLEAIEDAVIRNGGKCQKCGEPLKKGSIRCYDHSNGIQIIGKEKPQWVFFHCDGCGYDNALWKVLRQIRAEKQLARERK